MKNSISAFTLIELLIVIAIIAILGSATVIVLNPTEMMAQARDNQRITDLKSLTKAIDLAKFHAGDMNYGTLNTIYVSIPQASSDCGYGSGNPLGLPTVPTGWSYSCATPANYRKTDGTGWIPVNISNLSSSLPTLPIDPINTTAENMFYTYFAGSGTYEINAKTESQKNALGGALDQLSTDGGDNFTRMERGTDLTIAPWSLEFNDFSLATQNNKPGWKKLEGAGTVVFGSDTDAKFARATGYSRYEWQENIPFNPSATYKFTIAFRQITDPTTGGKGLYSGYSGVAADGVTRVARDGTNSYGTQHYHGSTDVSKLAGDPFAEYIGYTKGYAATGTYSGCTLAAPCKMHTNVRYMRPQFLINYASGDGIADIDYIRIEKI